MSNTAKNDNRRWRVQFYLLDSNDYLGEYAVLHEWTYLEAASLVLGLKPPCKVENRLLRLGVFPEGGVTQDDIDAFDPVDKELRRSFMNLLKSIRQQWPGCDPVAAEVIQWAIGKGLVTHCRFTRIVLGEVATTAKVTEIAPRGAQVKSLKSNHDKLTDGRGAHHETKRLAILGFAIKELALSCEASMGLIRDGGVNSTALAHLLHDRREELGIPPEDVNGFSFRAIENSLRDAGAAIRSIATTKRTDKN